MTAESCVSSVLLVRRNENAFNPTRRDRHVDQQLDIGNRVDVRVPPTVPSPPPATSVQLSPTADTYVRGGRFASRNYGRLQQLEVRNDADASNVRVAYLMFDITSVASVGRATLRVYGRRAERTPGLAWSPLAVTSQTWQSGKADGVGDAVFWRSSDPSRAGLHQSAYPSGYSRRAQYN